MGHSASEQLQYGTLVTPLELACRIPQTELPKHGVSFWKKLEIITVYNHTKWPKILHSN